MKYSLFILLLLLTTNLSGQKLDSDYSFNVNLFTIYDSNGKTVATQVEVIHIFKYGNVLYIRSDETGNERKYLLHYYGTIKNRSWYVYRSNDNDKEKIIEVDPVNQEVYIRSKDSVIHYKIIEI